MHYTDGMSFLAEAYKLGAARAVDDFTSRLDAGSDNPTAAPPMKMAGRRAVDEILKDAGKKDLVKLVRPRTISRAPTKTTNRGLQRLRDKIRKHK